ncbi:hypothetical protein, partial [Tistlia consotensis]
MNLPGTSQAFDQGHDIEGYDSGARDARPGRRGGFGIAPRLFLSFGGVAALTLLACGVAVIGGRDVRKSFSIATDRSVPALTEALTQQAGAASLAAAAPLLAAAGSEAERTAERDGLNGKLATLESGVERLQALGARPERIEAIRNDIAALAGATGSLDKAVALEGKLAAEIAGRRQAMNAAHAALLDSADQATKTSSDNMNMAGVATGMTFKSRMHSLLKHEVADVTRGLEASAGVERLGRLLFAGLAAGEPGELDRLSGLFDKQAKALQSALGRLPEGAWSTPLKEALAALKALGSGPDGVFEQRRGLLALPAAERRDAEQAQAGLAGRVEAATDALAKQLGPLQDESERNLKIASKQTVSESNDAIRSLMDESVKSLRGILSLKAEGNRMAGLMGQATTAPNAEVLKQLQADFAETASRAAAALAGTDKLAEQLDAKRAPLQVFGEKAGNVFELRSEQLAAQRQAEQALSESRQAA